MSWQLKGCDVICRDRDGQLGVEEVEGLVEGKEEIETRKSEGFILARLERLTNNIRNEFGEG